MAKINLTVPDRLKKQMLEFDNLNWSSVAAEAFAKAIEKEQIMSLDMDDMDNVVTRFKAAIAQEDERYGEAGAKWAKHDATLDELRCIARCQEDEYHFAMDDIAKHYRAENNLFFWQEVMEEDFNLQPSEEAKTIFARAAAQVWSEIREYL